MLLLRLSGAALVALTHATVLVQYDGEDYRRLAASIASGSGFQNTTIRWFEAPRPEGLAPEAFRPPLLPLLAGLALLGDSTSIVRLLMLQAVLATLETVALGAVLLRIAGERAAWSGAALFTVHPLFMLYSLSFSTEILFSLCLTCFLWAWFTDCRGKWALLGGAIALGTLARPTGLLLLPLSVAALLLKGRSSLKAVTVATAAFLLVMSPWLARNYIAFGEARPTTFYGGYVFWLGNNCYNQAAYRASTGLEFLRLQGEGFSEGIRLAQTMREGRYRDPGEQEAFWVQQAWRDIRRCGIASWIELLARKAWHFWRPWPLSSAHPQWLFWAVALTETGLFVAGIGGLWLLWRKSREMLVPFAIVVTAGTVAHTLTFAHLRHRVPFVDLVMLIGAAVLIGSAWARRAARVS